MSISASHKILLAFIYSFFVSSLASAECSLNMVYKDGGKEPLITAKPSHDGVYYDVFNEAAKRIGCSLKVSRYPKKRLHILLKKGELDFYPGASFSEKRAQYLYYLPNGLQTGEYGVTNSSVPELSSYEDLKKHDLIWLMEIGSSKRDRADRLGVTVRERKHFDLSFVAKFVNRSQDTNYFYVADKELVDYFHSQTGKTLKASGLSLHKNCCGGDSPMYLGFSRFSEKFKEVKNAHYDARRELTPTNYPVSVSEDSVAFKFGQALMAMKSEGVTDTIYNKWFKK